MASAESAAFAALDFGAQLRSIERAMPIGAAESEFALSASTIRPLLPRPDARFALRYCSIAGLLFAIYAFPYELFGARHDWLAGYLCAYARLAGGVLQLFDSSVVVSGAQIGGRFPLEIARNCDAIEINILFVSAVLAFPASLSRRVAVLGVGLLALVLLNLLRICALYALGVYAPGAFVVAHEQVFPLVLVIGAALIFLCGVGFLTGARRAE
jgi:exosortase/archaeosortase family protein